MSLAPSFVASNTGSRPLHTLDLPELERLALQSLGYFLQGPQATPTAAMRAAAVNIFNQLRNLAPDWDPQHEALRRWVDPNIYYGPQVAQALQRYAIGEIERGRLTPEEAFNQWFQRSGTTADAVLRDWDAARRLFAAGGYAIDPYTGQTVLSAPFLAATAEMGTETLRNLGLSPANFNLQTGILDEPSVRAAIDTLSSFTPRESQARVEDTGRRETPRAEEQRMTAQQTQQAIRNIDVAGDLIEMFKILGLTRDMAYQVLGRFLTFLDAEQANQVRNWIETSNLPENFAGNPILAEMMINAYLTRLRNQTQP